MPKVLSLLQHEDLHKVSRFTGLSVATLEHLTEETPILGDVLRRLYRYFNLEIDDFYVKNVENHPRRKKHEGIIGEIFRLRRVSLGLTIANVAKILRVSETTIDRLERSVQLPGSSSYTISKLLLLYHFDEEEKEVIETAIDALRRLHRMKKSP